MVLDRFPDARALATPGVVEVMRQQASPEAVGSFWEKRFPGQIPKHLVIAEALTGPVLDLEGHDLVVVELGHTDTDNTTCLHVPDIGLVVAGDAAYNDVHLYLAESSAEKRWQWIAALDAIEALDPRAVVAGHKRAGRPTTPASSRRPGSTYAISTGWPRPRRRPENSTSRCWPSIPTVSTPPSCGPQRRP